ncbi:MAG: 7,8-didemethyl-8-hydroxy-5-deazariboflavin synthase CofG [Chloroflexota bacterium]
MTRTAQQAPAAFSRALERALAGDALSLDEARALMSASADALPALCEAAASLNLQARSHRRVTYSRKVFLPLTNLCRDRCGYCTFVRGPRQAGAHTMSPDEVLDVARRGAALGCKEALISLGDHPELRHPEHQDTLSAWGYGSTVEYTAAMAQLVLEETGLVPHTNCGTLSDAEMALLTPWNASMGIMLEGVSPRLFAKGGAHQDTFTKRPEQRVATLEVAARARMAMTTGILIGIGESPEERADALMLIADVHQRTGVVQEVIVQNFRAKRSTRMSGAPEPDTGEVVRTLAAARLILGPQMNIQAPPNLNEDFGAYLSTGINDWGGISPLTMDFINPEAAWPAVDRLRAVTAEAGFTLRERTALYPGFIGAGWAGDTPAGRRVRELAGEDGFVREELEAW